MCLGLPLKVIEINDKEAIGEVEGIKRKIRVDLVPKVKINDYVMVHAGFAIDIIDEKTAKESAEAFMEVERAVENNETED